MQKFNLEVLLGLLHRPPLFFQPAKSRVENVKDIATDLDLSGEGALVHLKDCHRSPREQKETLSPHPSHAGKESHKIQLGCYSCELPSGVRSILCPYLMHMLSLSNNGRDASFIQMCDHDYTLARTKCRHVSRPSHTPLAPCACAFMYNDTSGAMNVESYLASYSDEYIMNLKQNEFNLGCVPKKLFPNYLRFEVYCKSSGDDESSSLQSSKVDFVSQLEEQDESNLLLLSPKESDGNGDDSEFSAHSPSSLSSCESLDYTISKAWRSKDFVQGLWRKNQQKYQFYMHYILRRQKRHPDIPTITPSVRAVLIDWLIEVAEEYDLGSISLHTAVGLVDRCLANERCDIVWGSGRGGDKLTKATDDDCDSDVMSPKCRSGKDKKMLGSRKKSYLLEVDRKTIQLLGCGCMMIASKMHEVHPPDTKDFSYISASQYSIREITTIEKDICNLLAFHLHIVTPHHFANIYLRASYVSGNGMNRPACSMNYNSGGSGVKERKTDSNGQLTIRFMVEYLLEVSMLNYDFVYLEPSRLAASAIYLARATLGIRDAADPHDEYRQGFFSRTLKYYSDYDAQDLKDTVMTLHEKHKTVHSDTLKSVYEKYKKEKFHRVALKPPVDTDLLTSSFNRFQLYGNELK